MAKVCEKCNKKSMAGNNVSHSNVKTKRKWQVNLQKCKVVENGVEKKMNLCVACIRSMHKL